MANGNEEWNSYGRTILQEDEEEDLGEWDSSDEEHDGNCCAWLMKRERRFHWIVITVIVLNTIWLAIECNYQKTEPPHYRIIELFFMVAFSLELGIRLCGQGCAFFTDEDEKWWNIFDFTIVVVGLIDFIIDLSFPTKSKNSVSLCRVATALRVVRCLRVLRSLRLLKQFRQLNLLVEGFVTALGAAMWMSVAFSLILLIFAIFATNILGHYAEDWGDRADYMEEHFGTFTQSFFTMFQLITLDNWSELCRTVMEQQPLMALFFMAYIMLMAFTMMSLLTGVISQEITENAMEDAGDQQEEDRKDFMITFCRGFKKASHGVGLTKKEVIEVFEDKRLSKSKRMLHKHGIQLTSHDIEVILEVMEVGEEDRVTWNPLETSLNHFMESNSNGNIFRLRSDIRCLDRKLSSMGLAGAAVNVRSLAPFNGQNPQALNLFPPQTASGSSSPMIRYPSRATMPLPSSLSSPPTPTRLS